MQSKEKIKIDARTFPEIWNGLTKEEQEELQLKLQVRLKCSSMTVRNYRQGKTTPTSAVVKAAIVSTIQTVTGIRASAVYLFKKN